MFLPGSSSGRNSCSRYKHSSSSGFCARDIDKALGFVVLQGLVGVVDFAHLFELDVACCTFVAFNLCSSF